MNIIGPTWTFQIIKEIQTDRGWCPTEASDSDWAHTKAVVVCWLHCLFHKSGERWSKKVIVWQKLCYDVLSLNKGNATPPKLALMEEKKK